MKSILSLLSLLTMMGFAQQSAARSIYCVQVSPATVNGYIIEEAVLSPAGSSPGIVIKNLGTGVRNENGDGTVSRTLLSSNTVFTPNAQHQAQSSQWRDTFAFVLPIEQNSTTVLYIPRGAFAGGGSAEFQARMKVSRQNNERNFTLYCNFQ